MHFLINQTLTRYTFRQKGERTSCIYMVIKWLHFTVKEAYAPQGS